MDVKYWCTVLRQLQIGNDVFVQIERGNKVTTKYVKSKNTCFSRNVQIFVGSRMYFKSDISVKNWFLKADDVESIIDVLISQKAGEHCIICQSTSEIAHVDISKRKTDTRVKLSLRLEVRFSGPHQETTLYAG